MVRFPYTVGQMILPKGPHPQLHQKTETVNLCVLYLAASETAGGLRSVDALGRKMKLAKAGYSWRMLWGGRERVFLFVEFSATKKGSETCHVTKSTYLFPVCVPLSMYLHYLLMHVHVTP